MNKIILVLFILLFSKYLFAKEELEDRINNIEERLETIEKKIDELLNKEADPMSVADLLKDLRNNRGDTKEDIETIIEDENSIGHLIKFEAIDIGFEKSKNEFDFVDEYLFFKYKIINNYEKKIKLIDHGVLVKDLLGENLVKLNLDKDLIISPTKYRIDEGRYDVSFTFSGDPKRIKKIPMNDLVFEYILSKIVFEDNSILSFE